MLKARGNGPCVKLLLALLLCGAGPALGKPRDSGKDMLPMQVLEALTCRSVREGAELLEPVDPAERFLSAEKQVTSFVRFQHVFKAHKIQWRWYDPDGKLYTQSSEYPVTLSGKYHEFFTGAHSILVQGERAMLLPGEWKVAVFLDGVLSASTSFSLSTREGGP